MDDEVQNAFRDKQIFSDFIAKYKLLPELWDVRSQEYCKRDKKNAAYEQLLTIFKTLKCDATVDNVKNVIYSLRSDFRKELKKIDDSKRNGAGIDDIYQPSSWVFKELTFLTDVEKPVESISSINEKTNDAKCIDDSRRLVESNVSFAQSQPKKLKSSTTTMSQQTDIPSLACGYLSKQDNKQDNDLDPTKVWANKLKNLDPNQRLFAEKAINNILFEAQHGTLNKNSVQINERYSPSFTPLSSTPSSLSSTSDIERP